MDDNEKHIASKAVSAGKYTIIFRMLSQAISLVVTILLVRALSEHDYGIYNLLYSIIGLLGMVASFGLVDTLQRYIPEYYRRGEFRIANNLYRIASIIRLLTNVVILGLVLILWELIAPYLKIVEYKNYFMLFSVIIFLHMQRGLLEICLGSFFLQKYSHGLAFAFVIIKAVGYALAVLIRVNLWFILIIDLIAYTMIFFVLQVIYYKKIPISKGNLKRINKSEKSRLLRYSAFYNFNDAGVGLLDASFDNFIIVMYLNPVAVGAYAFCQRVTKMIGRLIPTNYLLEVIRPAFFSIGSESNTKQINQFFQSLVKISYIFNIPIFFFIAILGQEFIRAFFGGKFLDYNYVLTVVCYFSMLNAFQAPLGLVAQLKERADIVLYSKVFAFYNLIADIVLIKYFGIIGAVFATGTAVLGKNFFIWYFIRRAASFKGMEKFFFQSIIFWCFISCIVILIKYFVDNYLFLIIVGFIIFIISFGLQFFFKPFNEYERKIFESLVKQNRKIEIFTRLLWKRTV